MKNRFVQNSIDIPKSNKLSHFENQIKLRKLLQNESFENLNEEQIENMMQYIQNVKIPKNRSELGRYNLLNVNPNIPLFMKPAFTERFGDHRTKVLTN